jgi:hypothetical protein
MIETLTATSSQTFKLLMSRSTAGVVQFISDDVRNYTKEVIELGGSRYILSVHLSDPERCCIKDMRVTDFCLAHIDGIAVGYSYRCLSEDNNRYDYHGGVLVSCDYRRRGIGSQLAQRVGFKPKKTRTFYELA